MNNSSVDTSKFNHRVSILRKKGNNTQELITVWAQVGYNKNDPKQKKFMIRNIPGLVVGDIVRHKNIDYLISSISHVDGNRKGRFGTLLMLANQM